MYISKNWLKDFVKIPDSLSAKELALKLTLATAEVEGFIDQKENLKGVIVGEILEVSKHPNADKLKLTKVNVGDNVLAIVCGAPNIEVGQKVPVAMIGAKLPNGMEIQKVKVRGEESEGMLCAEDELGLGNYHSGILVLDKKTPLGISLASALGADDVVFEIENKTLTHRPDLWSHYGLAREVAVLLNEKLKKYEPAEVTEGKEKLDIKIDNYELCPRYMGAVIEGIEIAPSPDWLKKRVEAVGMRSINNIVDITNYVMMEIGQPLHAFDYDKLEGHRIVVRQAQPGEKIKTLDDKDRDLDKSILVIADASRPVAIAGVMGGANTEIDNQTKKIIIESANFNHVSIRETESKLALRSEASIRFEKSLDPNICELGIRKAIELVLQLCPKAKVISKVADVKKFKLKQGPLIVSLDFINKRIGQVVSDKKIVSILENLGFDVKKHKDDLEIIIPSWRATKDIGIPEDIVEEVARICGYNELALVMPVIEMNRVTPNVERELERKIKTILAYGLGMNEVYNYSFNSEELIAKLDLSAEEYIKVANPLSSETSLMRMMLLPNLLINLVSNNKNFDDLYLFEVGSTHIKSAKGDRISDKDTKTLPLQEKYVAGVISEKGNQQPFYNAKNILLSLLNQLHFDCRLVKGEKSGVLAKKSRSLEVWINNEKIGHLAELDDHYYKKLDLENKVAFFEINLSGLAELYSDEIRYRAIPKFPSVDLDISIILEKKILWEQVKNCVWEVDKELIRSVKIFDVYEGKGIAEGQKSIAFRIEYRSDDKTLTMDEVQIIHNKVLAALENKLHAQIRK